MRIEPQRLPKFERELHVEKEATYELRCYGMFPNSGSHVKVQTKHLKPGIYRLTAEAITEPVWEVKEVK